jgi:hypothetical protein
MSANLVVLSKSKDRSELRVPRIASKGEVWFLVDIAQVSSHTPEQIEAIAESLGYASELRIAEYIRNDQKTLEPVLLLHHEILPESTHPLDFDEAIPEMLLNHWEQLASTLQPSTAVHLRLGS